MGGSGMGGVKFHNQLWRVYFPGIFPAIVFITIPFPSDEILESSPEYAAVQYGLNFILFLSINKDLVGRWAALPSQNWIHRCRHEFYHQEDWVQLAHGPGQSESVGMVSNLIYYHVWAGIDVPASWMAGWSEYHSHLDTLCLPGHTWVLVPCAGCNSGSCHPEP